MRTRLRRCQIAYLCAIESWCQSGASLWTALLVTDTSESDWCALVRFSRRTDHPLAIELRPYIDRLLGYPWIFRNGEGPQYYHRQEPDDRRKLIGWQDF